ncbi:ATP-dependent helicase [Candidatus Nomurabacteria bacterium]|nr:ATP-dependent helicase [Candidatus Nomurabacteria bacterium]
MDEFKKRYSKLNTNQKKAVDTIDGPLLVIAGPGTGKTELLSMRTANILQKTDTLPSSILCLTFTDSGAAAMRERLAGIIGPDAYKVAIHTFHSFGSEIINQNSEYFYKGADVLPADELAQYGILRDIFNELDYDNPLAGMNGDEFTYLNDTKRSLSEIKQAGLTSSELLRILDANEFVIDLIAQDIDKIMSPSINKSTAANLVELAKKVAAIDQPKLPEGITPYANTLALSMAHAIDEAESTDSTKPITAWKKKWCERDSSGSQVLKDKKQIRKLRAVAAIYDKYISRMREKKLYDFDDMILETIHAIEVNPDLKANIQEKYLYVMVDEFQDTNQAQLRILLNIMPDNDSNVMAVGDDDQAIFSFQGADANNIGTFRAHYDENVVVLTDNYRSDEKILQTAREVVVQAEDRLEDTLSGISKKLTARHKPAKSLVKVCEYSDPDLERSKVAEAVKELVESGEKPESIAVLARRHFELEALLPHFSKAGISVNYEKRENVLEHEITKTIERCLKVIDGINRNLLDDANAMVPELIAHPAFKFSAESIWKLSLKAYRSRELWLETIKLEKDFQVFAEWIHKIANDARNQPLEYTIDQIVGIGDDSSPLKWAPLHEYYFGPKRREHDPELYLSTLEALRTIRDKLREYAGNERPTIGDFLEFLRIHRELKTGIVAIRRRGDDVSGQVNLMTAHKSKGLEFDYVFIVGAVDNMWGEKARSRSRLVSWPENLKLQAAGTTPSERIRLFYVAMTRAKKQLSVSYSKSTSTGKDTLIASFLSGDSINPTVDGTVLSTEENTELIELSWHDKLTKNPTPANLRALLEPTLETYKLSATHLGNFLDVSKGGPQTFLLNNLLRFPQAKSPNASYGTAIHAALQSAHNSVRKNKSKQPIEDIVSQFEQVLKSQHMSDSDFELFLARGADALNAFFEQKYLTFNKDQRTELNFSNQGVQIGDARLTGSLDLVDIDDEDNTIHVTDYKTGKPSKDWRGRSEYEKIKLHKYRQQLMFYQLLAENSRDYSKYRFKGGTLQFVEPEQVSKDILALQQTFSDEDLAEFSTLIEAVWKSITTLDLPDHSAYPPTLRGIQSFEHDLVDKYSSS